MVTLPRPHRLYVQQSAPAGKDAYGFDLPPLTEWALWCECRMQPSGQSRERHGKNGESYAYAATVFAGVDVPEIENGTQVEVRWPQGKAILSGEVKGFSRDMMHVRMWV